MVTWAKSVSSFTPKGDCRGLRVRRQVGASFEVRELQGGKSNVTFSYRIVGRRKDVKGAQALRQNRHARAEAAARTRRRKQATAMRALLDTLEKHREKTKSARKRK